MQQRIVIAASALACVLATGCSAPERSYGVRIIVPEGFRGTIRIVFDDSGAAPIWEEGQLVFRVPESGIVRTTGANPFLKFGDIEVVTEGGDTIVVADFDPDRDAPDEVLFRFVGGTADGRQFWAVVGTEDEAGEARLALGEVESDLQRGVN